MDTILMIILTILTITWVILGIFCIYMSIRNNFVCDLQIKITDLVYSKSNWRQRKKVFLESVTYGDMFWQFWKPVKLESWFTKEQIEELNN